MIFFLSKNIWGDKKGTPFGETPYPLKVNYHTGQDFHTSPIGVIPVIAPCGGCLTTFPFSKSAGWWGYYKFDYNGETYSLKILHMYKQMEDGVYKKGDILGLCGATGLSITKKHGIAYIGDSHQEQSSEKAVPHLHIELHKGEYQHDTNHIKKLANERIIDPISTFEKWIKELSNKNMVVEKTKKKNTVIQEEKKLEIQESKPKTTCYIKNKNTNVWWKEIIEIIVKLLKRDKR
jgi:hypothetical protein